MDFKPCGLVPCRVLNELAFKISEANEMSLENSYECAHNRVVGQKKHLIDEMFGGPLEARTLCGLVPCRVLNALAFNISEANKMSPENSYECAHNRFVGKKKKHLISEMFGGPPGTRTLDLPVMSRAL